MGTGGGYLVSGTDFYTCELLQLLLHKAAHCFAIGKMLGAVVFVQFFSKGNHFISFREFLLFHYCKQRR